MKLEILTARELYRRGEIDELEVEDPKLFGNRKVMIFSNEKERFQFAYAFVTQYLVPKYGRKEAANFPMLKTGPDRNNRRPEWRKAISESNSNPGWIAIPGERFSEVEEFLLNKYNLNTASEPKQ